MRSLPGLYFSSFQPAGSHGSSCHPRTGIRAGKRLIKTYRRMDARNYLGYGKKTAAFQLAASPVKHVLCEFLALFLSKEV